MGPAEIADRIEALTGERPRQPLTIVRDTSDFVAINRGDVIELEDRLFLVRRNEREGRFGLDEQPKFWVKRTVDLESGETYILKLVFHEDFVTRIGGLRIRSTRSARKEAQVLEAVRGDLRFMQGHTVPDARGNLVRIIDFIPGPSLYNHLLGHDVPHEAYFREELPAVLERVLEGLAGIQSLHALGLCHGDIRNDHILIDPTSGRYRWIDFDLAQHPDIDVWSIGNILHCVVGKDIITFHDVRRDRPEVAERLTREDASVVFKNRVMNMRKLFPYVPERLNSILMRFAIGTEGCFESVRQLSDEIADFIATRPAST